MINSRFYSVVSLFFGILAVSTASIFIRFAQSEAPSLVIATIRLLVASLLTAPLAIIQYRNQLFNFSKKEIGLLILSGFFLAIHFSAWITSLEFTSVTSSVVLVTTTPLWVAIFSPIFLKEKNQSGIWYGLILSLVGSSLVALSNQCGISETGLLVCQREIMSFDKFSLIGNLLALLGAWMAAGYLMVGRRVRSSTPLILYIFYVYLFSTIFLLFFTFVSGQSLWGYSEKTYLWMILLGIVPQLIGHSIFNWTLGHLPAAFVSIALIGEPVGTVILAFFFLHENPTILELGGGVLILSGIVLVSLLNQKKE